MMDFTPPPVPAKPRGKIQWEIMRKLKRARGQSLPMPKGTTDHTKSQIRAIRTLAEKGLVMIVADRYRRR